ncbi:terpene synthase family protein [Granulicella mallensis]|jgi:hypothetical protein|uniref:Terpene synthase n=1 Tax=Granulicella mallensis (strain ATCC BAA-1857 / DSM 23137 / MP5ACTX8) TaxID=682795 RepID=G8NTZ9_GRAMM|nr:sesquiterpene cyclase [Granulicella mallensis]AEU37555.1 Terpene synthase metal-binding domain-containing protein [Granulicella mallensis MP5ACTX8]
MSAELVNELQQIRVPNFEFPWAAACSPFADLVEQEMQGWALEYGLLPNKQYLDRVSRTKYAWLAARCYPRANRELLRTIADYFIWFFLADDLFVDRVETIGPSTIPNLTAMIDVLDFNRLSACPVYGEEAWLDICMRLRKQLSHEHFQRFANGMRMWASTAGLQILNHTQSQSVEVGHYETIRRHTSGMNPCLDLSDIANDGPLLAEEYYRPDVQQLRRHANHVVCWSNDIQSLAVELRQPGQYWNMVGIYAGQGRSLQEGIDYTAKRVCSEIQEFSRLSEVVERSASPELRGYIAGMKDWMSGYQAWVVSDTQRYSEAFAEQDADDRGLLLA